MAEVKLFARGALEGIAKAGQHGVETEAGVTLSARASVRQTLVLAHRGQAERLVETCRTRGLDLPPPGRASIGRDLTIVATGPGQWLAVGEDFSADLAGQLFAPLSGACTLVRADDARVLLHIGGPAARKMLAKLLSIDLHPRVFSPGTAAVTLAAGIAVTLWQLDPTPRYALATPRSTARSLWHWLVEAAAEYGCAVEQPGPEVARAARGS